MENPNTLPSTFPLTSTQTPTHFPTPPSTLPYTSPHHLTHFPTPIPIFFLSPQHTFVHLSPYLSPHLTPYTLPDVAKEGWGAVRPKRHAWGAAFWISFMQLIFLNFFEQLLLGYIAYLLIVNHLTVLPRAQAQSCGNGPRHLV